MREINANLNLGFLLINTLAKYYVVGMTAHEFKQVRESLGLSQKDFGALFGFTAPQIRVSEIERGVKGISNQVEKLCTYILLVSAKQKIH